jgi:hypothetical protein
VAKAKRTNAIDTTNIASSIDITTAPGPMLGQHSVVKVNQTSLNDRWHSQRAGGHLLAMFAGSDLIHRKTLEKGWMGLPQSDT